MLRLGAPRGRRRVELNKITFMMTATPAVGGERLFQASIEGVVENGAGGASFTAVGIDDTRAVLQGEIVGDARLVTARGLAEYLEDTLASKAGIQLRLDVELAARSRAERFRAA